MATKLLGLKLQLPDGSWYTPDIPETAPLTAILLTGIQLELCTNGRIKAPPHVVTITPEQQKKESQLPPNQMRFMLTAWAISNAEKLKPTRTKDGALIQGKEGESSLVTTLSKQFSAAKGRDPNTSPDEVDTGELFEDHFEGYERKAMERAVDEEGLEHLLKVYPETSEYDKRFAKKPTTPTAQMVRRREKEGLHLKAPKPDDAKKRGPSSDGPCLLNL